MRGLFPLGFFAATAPHPFQPFVDDLRTLPQSEPSSSMPASSVGRRDREVLEEGGSQ
jgi:hypothetical protein